MKVTEKRTEDDNLLFTAVASPEEVNEAYAVAQMAFAQQMGLRPDGEKSIMQVAEEKLGIKNLDSIVEKQAAEYLVPFVLDKKNVIPGRVPPETKTTAPMKRGSEYTFEIEVMLKPEYSLNSYDPVKITVPPFELDDREVDHQLANMAETYAEYVATDPHPVESGDHVLLAIEATRDGEDLPGLSTDARTYTAGVGYMPDGFDENVIGMEVGQTKSFTFTGPGFDEEGNDVEEVVACKVTVKELQKKVIPPVDDAWVKKYMPMYKDLEELKTAMRSEVGEGQRSEYETFKRQRAITELATRFQGKIVDEVYEAMQTTLMNNIKTQLGQQKIEMKDFIEQNGGEQQFSMMMMMQTRQTLVEGYSLDALYRHEKMSISDADIMEVCASMNPKSPEDVKKQMEKAGCSFILRESAERLKAAKWLLEHAEVVEESTSQDAVVPSTN